MPSSPPRHGGVRFCLDANLSYRVAEAVDPRVADIIHISRVESLTGVSRGRSNAPDEEVARWCAGNERVLVTCDDDFRGRKDRTASLTESGLEVIVFVSGLRGLHNQIDTVSRRAVHWQERLGDLPYGPRVWLQYSRGGLQVQR